MQVYDDLMSMQAAVQAINASDSEAKRIEGLCNIAFRPSVGEMRHVDPFSSRYRDMVIDIYKSISGRDRYSVAENELSPFATEIKSDRPIHYNLGSTAIAGELMSAIGQALIALDALPGQRILEYGPGEGVLALEAAKTGCHVTVADIEPLFLDIIERRAQAARVSVRTVCGEFGCDCGGNYDRILFYEAFHHALDHAELLKRLHTMLSPAGKLLLIGEPVIGPHNEHWRPTLSYPWGLRLDGLSFRAIQTYGWMELGFDQSYLIEALMRAGFLADFRPSAATDRGSAYVATPYQSAINLGAPFLLLSSGRYDDWHGGEGDHRWTASEEAVLPLREHDGTIEVTLVNYHGDTRDFELETTAATVRGQLPPAEVSAITLAAGSRLVIRSKVQPAGGSDPRSMGLAVKSVRFL